MRLSAIAIVALIVYQLLSGIATYRTASATMSARVAVIESIEGGR